MNVYESVWGFMMVHMNVYEGVWMYMSPYDSI